MNILITEIQLKKLVVELGTIDHFYKRSDERIVNDYRVYFIGYSAGSKIRKFVGAYHVPSNIKQQIEDKLKIVEFLDFPTDIKITYILRDFKPNHLFQEIEFTNKETKIWVRDKMEDRRVKGDLYFADPESPHDPFDPDFFYGEVLIAIIKKNHYWTTYVARYTQLNNPDKSKYGIIVNSNKEINNLSVNSGEEYYNKRKTA